MKCTECPHRKIVDGDECNLTREVCKMARRTIHLCFIENVPGFEWTKVNGAPQWCPLRFTKKEASQ